MIRLLIIVTGLYFSWDAMDIQSPDTGPGLMAPVVFAGFVVALFFWIANRLMSTSSSGGHGGDGGLDTGFGGDCGGGD